MFGKKEKRTFVTTSDNSIGFFKENYVSHYVSGSYCWFIHMCFKRSPYSMLVQYPNTGRALKSLTEIIAK